MRAQPPNAGPMYDVAATTLSYHFLVSHTVLEPIWRDTRTGVTVLIK